MVRNHSLCSSLAAAAIMALLTMSVASAKTELLVFSSPYCGPCQQLKPTVAEFEQQGYPIRRVDVTQHRALASQFRVSRVPCLVMVADGRELSRQEGGDKATIARMFAAAKVQPGRVDREVVPNWVQDTPAAPALPLQSTPPSSFQPAVRPVSHATPVAAAVDAAPATDALATRLLESTVRITIEDATGKSYGTGTIIDTREADALVVTCGHLFRGESEKGSILIERFRVTPGGLQISEQARGELVSFDLDRDVGLVSFRPRTEVKVAPVAAEFVERVNDRVWSVGCDRGADPTVRDSRVTDINRYHGPPNIETSGAPVQGRSGGGLFNSRGELIGVCFAADQEGDEGLYSGLASVHAELDNLGLQAVYRSTGAGQAMARNEPQTLMPLPVPGNDRVVRGQDAAPSFATATPPASTPPASITAFPEPPSTAPATELPPVERAGLEEIARRATESEVVVIIRPRDAGGDSEVIKFDRVSPQFIQALRAMPQ